MSTEMKNWNPPPFFFCFFEIRSHCIAWCPQIQEIHLTLLPMCHYWPWIKYFICILKYAQLFKFLLNEWKKKRKIFSLLKSQSTVRLYLLHQSSRFRKHISKWFTEYDCIFPFAILYDVISKIKEIQTVGICSWRWKTIKKSYFILSANCSKFIDFKELIFYYIILSLWVFCLLICTSYACSFIICMQCPWRPGEGIRAASVPKLWASLQPQLSIFIWTNYMNEIVNNKQLTNGLIY